MRGGRCNHSGGRSKAGLYPGAVAVGAGSACALGVFVVLGAGKQEAYFDAAQFVHENFFPGRADNDGADKAGVGDGFGIEIENEGNAAPYCGEAVAIVRRGVFSAVLVEQTTNVDGEVVVGFDFHAREHELPLFLVVLLIQLGLAADFTPCARAKMALSTLAFKAFGGQFVGSHSQIAVAFEVVAVVAEVGAVESIIFETGGDALADFALVVAAASLCLVDSSSLVVPTAAHDAAALDAASGVELGDGVALLGSVGALKMGDFARVLVEAPGVVREDEGMMRCVAVLVVGVGLEEPCPSFALPQAQQEVVIGFVDLKDQCSGGIAWQARKYRCP